MLKQGLLAGYSPLRDFKEPEPVHTCTHKHGSDFMKLFEPEEEYTDTGFYQSELKE